MVYLSHYSRYPIFEPAEGGYYYSGVSLVESERLSKRQAKKNLLEIAKEASEDVFGEWKYLPNSRMVTEVSKYIGEGDFYVIEKHKGSYIKGYEPYC